ncbi:MAG: hypothetical protein AB7H92_19415 [Microbacteriaceae bacterium]
MSVHEIRLPWPAPPLSLNDRGDWRARARRTKAVRRTAAAFVRAARIPHAERIRVTLTYHPRDRRTRDSDNVVATLKPVCDAIVDAGVVADDDPAHMAKDMPVIGTVDTKDPRLMLTIEVLEQVVR